MERCNMMERWRTDGEGRESGLMKTWTCDCFVHGEQKTGWWFRPIAPSDHVAAHFAVNDAVVSELRVRAMLPGCRREQGFVG